MRFVFEDANQIKNKSITDTQTFKTYYPSSMEDINTLLNNQDNLIKELTSNLEEFINLCGDYNIPFEKLCDAFEKSFEQDEKRKEYIRHLEGKIHRLKKRVQILEKR